MADLPHSNRNPSSASGAASGNGIAFVVGGLVIAVAVIAYFLLVQPQQSDDINIRIAVPPSMQNAGDAITGAASDAVDALHDAVPSN